MPITYQIDPERNLIIVTASGVLEEPEYRELRARLVSDPLFRPGMMQLEDFRAVEEHEFTAEGYDRFFEQEILLRPIFGEGRHAIVTHSDLHFGLTRKLASELGVSHEEARVFRSREEAEAWLFDDSDQ